MNIKRLIRIWKFRHYVGLLVVKYGELTSYPEFIDRHGDVHSVFVGMVALVEYKDTLDDFLILRNEHTTRIYQMCSTRWKLIARLSKTRYWIDWKYGGGIDYLFRIAESLDDIYRWKRW